ncbi:hypothetical protein [Nostoc sp. WHI]|uniref:hypothetical protein n=1 Tax=Nostoc sp. WHI TaxID=2650611 RepID=UPI0018C72AA5|nr:hypothetical protein [Nostoc sp. WHI]
MINTTIAIASRVKARATITYYQLLSIKNLTTTDNTFYFTVRNTTLAEGDCEALPWKT